MERGPFFCVLSYKNDIRQHWVISMFSRIPSNTHVLLEEFWWPRNGAIFGPQKKSRDAPDQCERFATGRPWWSQRRVTAFCTPKVPCSRSPFALTRIVLSCKWKLSMFECLFDKVLSADSSTAIAPSREDGSGGSCLEFGRVLCNISYKILLLLNVWDISSSQCDF